MLRTLENSTEEIPTVRFLNFLPQPGTRLTLISRRDGRLCKRVRTLSTATAEGRSTNGYEGWPGIVSRFQLILLAGRRSKQLLRGAQPRIPVNPLKRRNTSIALEELRRGLIPFRQNGNPSETILTAIHTVGDTNTFYSDLSKAESGQ